MKVFSGSLELTFSIPGHVIYYNKSVLEVGRGCKWEVDRVVPSYIVNSVIIYESLYSPYFLQTDHSLTATMRCMCRFCTGVVMSRINWKVQMEVIKHIAKHIMMVNDLNIVGNFMAVFLLHGIRHTELVDFKISKISITCRFSF